ncbi:MAG TPA: hypothetical protein VFP34_06865 [Microlunatus sp.]|nr:hypothetical protein [Microlunatus sp.]
MDRRLVGALLLLFAFVGAAVVSSAAGRGLAGAPVVIDLPGPPAVGDCLLTPPHQDSLTGGSATPDFPGFGPCGTAGVGPVVGTIGEVVAVRTLSGADRTVAADSDGCRSSALTYAGLRPHGDAFAVPGTPADDPIQWRYSVDVRTTWVTQVPSLPEASSWAACVAHPTAAVSGPGRLANAFGGGTLPGAYGTCWQSDDLSAAAQIVDCNEPHVAELIALGRAVNDGTLDPEEVRRSCVNQAAIVLRRADPTIGGTLAIRIDPDTLPASRIRSNPACYVTPADERRIIGSLVGLGPMPVTFAG